MKLNRRYTYHDIYARKASRNDKSSSMERDLVRESQIYKSDKNNTYGRENEAIKILTMIGESGYLSRKYYGVAKNILNEYHENMTVRNIFIEEVLPKSLDTDQTDLSSIDDLDQKAVQDRITKNMAIDRLLDNHEALNKDGKLDEFIKNTIDSRLCVDKCCETVNKFTKIPIHGKVTIALEEALYQLDANGKQYDPEKVMQEVWNYFSTGNITAKDKKNIIFGINHNVFTEDCTDVTCEPYDPIMDFQNSDNKNSELVDKTLNDVINSYPYQLANLMSRFFALIEYQILAAHDFTLAIYMIRLVPTIADKLSNSAFIANPGYRERILQIKDQIAIETARLTSDLKNLVDEADTKIQNLLAQYISQLAELDDDLDELLDNMYPKEDAEAMEDYDTDDEEVMSMERFDFSYRRPFVDLVEKADKFVEVYCRNDLKKVETKNFTEASTLDMIDFNHSIDYLFAEYYLISKPDHTKLNNICKSFNSTLDPHQNRCYYTVDENTVDFHLKSNIKLNLTEAQSSELANHIIQEDASKIDLILNLAEQVTIPLTQEEITDAFKESDTHQYFKPFIELCEYANINKSDLDPIYEATFRGNKTTDAYFNESFTAMMNYQVKNAPYEIQMEAANVISSIVEANDAKALSEKIKNGANKIAHPEKKEGGDKNVAGNPDSHPVKNALVNLNLTLRGFGEKIKDLSSKEQNLAKRNDAQFRHFAKVAQDTIIGDRKEAIIKGQLIPSFSKCIKYAVAGGIITVINPIAGIISVFGAIAISKHIDKKVKLDMLDEIEVELEMIDKEIANADNRGQLKKERALLKTKKQLQRTYQRIKINAKLGKNVIPSGFATPKLDD